MTFRWFGPEDPVRLPHIRQIPGVRGVVSALHDVPPGEAWPRARVARLRDEIEAAGLRWAVVESIPVHEEIKLGRATRDRWIDRFCRSLEAVGAEAIPAVCYNFMPVFDWTRTDLGMPLPDGSTALAYDHAELGVVERALGTGGLPGWMTAYTPAQLAALLTAYHEIGTEQLWEHLAYFLERVVPVAEAVGVKLAIHPDDPPWPVFGMPRIINNLKALERVCDLVDSPANGVTFCTGSLGANPSVDIPAAIRTLGCRARIHFAHLRNVVVTGEQCFHETAHPEHAPGSVDLVEAVRALCEVGFDGPARPDHGRTIWGESGRPGYGLFDRALGATYLLGLWEATARAESTALHTAWRAAAA